MRLISALPLQDFIRSDACSVVWESVRHDNPSGSAHVRC